MSGEGEKSGEPGITLLLSLLIKSVYHRISEPELGVRLKEFVALGYLRAHSGTSQHELGESICVDANNLVILLNELEAAGLALRRRDPEDRRRHLVDITPHGLDALTRAEAVVAEAEDEVLAGLTRAERSSLRNLLAKTVNDGSLLASLPA
jgi:DNA-binding MarR family transcriptional regulator